MFFFMFNSIKSYNISVATLEYALLACFGSNKLYQINCTPAFNRSNWRVLLRSHTIRTHVHWALRCGSCSSYCLSRLALRLPFVFKFRVRAHIFYSSWKKINARVCKKLNEHAASFFDRILIYKVFKIFWLITCLRLSHGMQYHS